MNSIRIGRHRAKSRAALFFSLMGLLSAGLAQGQTFLEDYSSAAPWTSVPANNAEVTVAGGTLNYINAVDEKDSRVYRQIPFMLDDNGFKTQFTFTPTNSSQTGPSTEILVLSANASNGFYATGHVPGANPQPAYTPSNNDALIVSFVSPANNPAGSLFRLYAKDGTATVAVTADMPFLGFNLTYTIRLERLNPTTCILSVLQGGNHIPGSPKCLVIPSTITGLQFLQHEAAWGGGAPRTFSGTVDNVNIANTGLVTPSLSAFAGADKIICKGQSVVLGGNSTGRDGTTPYSFAWAPAGSLNNAAADGPTATPAATTPYTVTVTDANRCTATSSVTVNVNALPTVAISPASSTLCKGASQNLTASGGSTYSWTQTANGGLNTATGTTVTATPSGSSTYTVVGTDANQCSASATASITVNPLPAVAINPASATLCKGASQNLTASGGSTYSWTQTANGGLNTTTGNTVTATPSGNSTYTVVGTDANQCRNSATASITVNPLPAVAINPASATLCKGASQNLTASGGSTYSWTQTANGGLNTTAGSTVTATPAASATYTVVGTDANQCKNSASATIKVNALPVVTVSPAAVTICSGSSQALNAGGAFTYTWSPATGLNPTTGSSVTATPSSNTVYTVTGTDGNGCSAKASSTITVQNCCFAANDPNFTTKYTQNTTISTDLVLSGKVYVAPNVIITVNKAKLDLTGVDMVFGTCAGIVFTNNATVIAQNSVFRSCDELKSWKGFDFTNTTGIIASSTVKNAQNGIALHAGAEVRITGNAFVNNQAGIMGDAGTLSYPIAGNTFSTDNTQVDFSGCGNVYAATDMFGIRFSGKGFRDVISQNNFVNSCYSNAKTVYGIYLLNVSSTGNISLNRFTDLYRGIDISGSSYMTVENNSFELTASHVTAADNYQVRLTGTSSQIQLKGNDFRNAAGGSFVRTAMYLESSNSSDVKSNKVFGFNNGISVNGCSKLFVSDNDIERANNNGIRIVGSTQVTATCNYIRMFNNAAYANTGIYFEQSANARNNCLITSNCVFEAKNAVMLNSTARNNPVLPVISNNYLYNYSVYGVYSSNFTGSIGTGLTDATAGRNTFMSNNISAGAYDVFSTVALTVAGNYNLMATNSNVTNRYGNNFYSTASCGNQISTNSYAAQADANCNGSFLANPPIGGKLIAFQPAADYVQQVNVQDPSARAGMLKAMMSLLAANETYTELDKLHADLGNFALSADQLAEAEYFYSYFRADEPAARAALARTNMPADARTIENVKLNAMTAGLQNIQETDVKALIAIDDANSEYAHEAREIVQAARGGRDYRFAAASELMTEKGDYLLISDENVLNAYPNPAQNEVTIIAVTREANASLEINDVLGRKVMDKPLVNSEKETISIESLVKGVYFVNIKKDGTVLKTLKLVKN